MTDPQTALVSDADDVERCSCPRCHAAPGSPCRSRSGAVAGAYHTGRFTKVPRLAKLLRVPTPADRDPGQPWRPGTPVPAPVDPDTPTADIHIGYARCSSLTQELQSQLDALAAKNIPRDKIFSEKISTRVRVRKVRSAQTERGIGGTMQKGTLEYEQALDAVIEILRARARQGASPLQYGQLSTELARLGHHVSPSEGPMPYLLEDASVRESPDGSLPLLSALVVLKDTGWPSSGFFKLARRAPYRRSGDDVELWTREIEKLAKHYAEHEH